MMGGRRRGSINELTTTMLDGRRALTWIAVVGFVVVTLVRSMTGSSGADGISIVYVVPVAALALRHGMFGGVVGVAIAVWLLVGALVVGDIQFSFVGFVTRLSAFVACGPLLGLVVDNGRSWRRVAEDEYVARSIAERIVEERDLAEPDPNHAILRRVVDAKRALERNDPVRAMAILQAVGGSAAELDRSLRGAPEVTKVR